MLTFRQLEDLGEAIQELLSETELSIIRDMARRIARLEGVTAATNWQMLRLELLGTQQELIIKELSRLLQVSEKKLIEIFDEAATRTLASDNQIYIKAGYSPVPLAENMYLQQIIRAGVTKTLGSYQNLTRTTARTATLQFEDALDLSYHQIVSGAFSYQQAIANGIRELTANGLQAIRYPSGRVDHLDVAFRRATLTGVNSTCGELQLGNAQALGADLVETTAHSGARPEHMVWQGRVFSLSGMHEKYPDFRIETGYGTGPGLCGWNCRHSFFPFIEGLSERDYTDEQLQDFMDKTVTFNGKEMSLYDATQQQRYIERQIRRWKRQSEALKAAGQDNSFALSKVRGWQAAQRDFIRQTGLKRDYFRERAGAQFGRSNPPTALSPAYVNIRDPVFKYSKNIKPVSGYEDVIVHGSKNGFAFIDGNGKETHVSVSKFVKIIKSSETYKGGDIRLIACETGSVGATAAQALADALRVNVMAPTDIVWIYPNGRIVIGPDELTNTGGWLIFNPRGLKK